MNLVGRIAKVTIKRSAQVQDERRFFVTETEQVEVTDLRIQFSIERHLRSEPNTCEITITNLAPPLRALLQRDAVVISLAAGYDNVARHLFTGDVRDAQTKRDGADLLTTVHLADGLRAHAQARVTRSYRSGTQVLTVLKDAAKSMGLLLPKAVEASAELRANFATGYVLEGPTRTELTRLLAPFGFTWSIQDGKLQIIHDEEMAPGAEREISVDTGMIGDPSFSFPQPSAKAPKHRKRPTMSVDTLLYPELVPGLAVRVKSDEINGRFKLDTVTHAGDTHGDDWTTTVEAKV